MADSGQPAEGTTLQNILNEHPGLQTREVEPGVETPVTDPSAENFLKTFGGDPATPNTRPERPEPTAPAPEQPSGRLLAGKYRTPEEMERAYLEAQKALRDREAENRALQAVNLHLEQVFQPLRRAERPEPTLPDAVPVSFDAQNQPIVKTDSLRQMVHEEAARIAREQVEATLRPISALNQANNRLRTEYPEVAQREADFAAWLSAHPDYQQKITQDPDFYLEGAYLKFERESGSATRSSQAQTTNAAQAMLNQARANAAPAGGAPTGVRRETEVDGMAKQLEAAYKHYQETGDAKPYKKLRTEMALGKSFTDQIERSSWGR